MAALRYYLGPMRISFLVLTPTCVALGYGAAVWTGYRVAPLHALLVLAGATAAHISVNAFNEYTDFRSGLDSWTSKTPFSGGSGTLQARPELAPYALGVAIGALLVAWLVGFFFVHAKGPAILIPPRGSALVIAYSRWIVKSSFWCLVAPGLGFGPAMVGGTFIALTGEICRTALIASSVPFFLVSGLLLLSQFPDVDADRSVGRKHLPIVIGRKRSALVYGILLSSSYCAIVAGSWRRFFPRRRRPRS